MGTYFNIVKNDLNHDQVVSYEELIVDLLVRADGRSFMHDQEELPASLHKTIEKGDVYKKLNELMRSHHRRSCQSFRKPGIFQNSRIWKKRGIVRSLRQRFERIHKGRGDYVKTMQGQATNINLALTTSRCQFTDAMFN